MKILFVVSRYSLAGVPLAQLRLAKAFSNSHDVFFLIGHSEVPIEIDSFCNIEMLIINKQRTIAMLPYIFKYLKMNKFDIIFSAEDNMNLITILGAKIANNKAKLSCSSRIHPMNSEAYGEFKNLFSRSWFLYHSYKYFSRYADALTTVSYDQATMYNKFFKTERYKAVYNISPIDNFKELSNQTIPEEELFRSDQKIFITACRLDYEKGVHDVIDAFSIFLDSNNAHLVILGDGPEKSKLINQCNNLGIKDSVSFLGYKNNIYSYLNKSDFFVFASHNEGMPNVLIEAIACGCTVISSNCETGPSELLRNGQFGYLFDVGDYKKLAELMSYAIKNQICEEKLEEALIPFDKEKIMKEHISLLF